MKIPVLILALALITSITVLAALGVITGQQLTQLLERLGEAAIAGGAGGGILHALTTRTTTKP